jgi:hypothetical protein
VNVYYFVTKSRNKNNHLKEWLAIHFLRK